MQSKGRNTAAHTRRMCTTTPKWVYSQRMKEGVLFIEDEAPLFSVAAKHRFV